MTLYRSGGGGGAMDIIIVANICAIINRQL